MKDNPEDDESIAFGEKESDVVIALVEGSRKKQSTIDRIRKQYEEFQNFKEDVINREREKLSHSMERINKESPNQNKSGNVPRISSFNVLSKTPEEIIGNLKRHSTNNLRHLSIFRNKTTKTGI